MSEQPTRRQVRATIRETFASAPPVADAHGKTELDRRLDLERSQRLDAAYAAQPAPVPTAPPAGMRPDPAQGRASTPEHITPPPPVDPVGTTAQRIRQRIEAAGDAAFDDGSGHTH